MRRLDIERLPPSRWSRIERSLFEKLDTNQTTQRELPPQRSGARTYVALVLAGAAAATIGAVGYDRLHAPAPAPPQALSRVATDLTGSHVDVGESSLDVAPHTVVSFRGDDTRGILVVLDHGDVDCEVAPRHGRPPFVVQAGTVTVRVIGTRFLVEHDGDTTRVSVVHGTVQVEERDHTTILNAGESWGTPSAPAVTASVPPPTPAATAAIATATAPAIVAPVPTVPSATSSVAAAAPSPRERYEQAAALETTNPAAALGGYRELAAGSGPWAMNALFAEARLESERGDKQNARRHADEYLARFPAGPNAADARELRARLE